MNISIDEDIVNTLKTYEGFKLTLPELLICMTVVMEENPIILTNKLIRRKVLAQQFDNSDKLLIFPKYLKLMEDILLTSDKTIPKLNTLEELVTKLQEVFPKEKKLDRLGIPRYAYRGNKTDVTNRLQKFFKLYGKYSYDDVLECTKRYVESFKYDKTYMKILPYYIIKDGESQLATELENMDCDDAATNNNDLNYGEALL